MACSSTCRTKDHASMGECLRAKGVRITHFAQGFDTTRQKRWDAELDLYASATKQGIQPKSTKTPDIRAALDASDALGQAFDAT